MNNSKRNMVKITKWCIRRTPENCDQINEWFNLNTKGVKFKRKNDFVRGWRNVTPHWKYLHYPKYKDKHLHSTIIKGYTEITFDEFKSNILDKKILILKKPKIDFILR